ncbi:hypothetical protein [Hyphomicrobium sp.]|uniref:hypothetical protein n=1 Tax=Hyphomicrobium sp. TaxID=82 RepID=UPI001D1FFF3C|nr:hypothetical protein [Hyphomicrobium sp.]MBY0562448.1 hypothetical protein [Hyphomicrobium sp.]
MDIETRHIAIALLDSGGNTFGAAELLRISRRELVGIIDRSPALQTIARGSGDLMVEIAEKKLAEAIRNADPQVLAFFERTIGRAQ